MSKGMTTVDGIEAERSYNRENGLHFISIVYAQSTAQTALHNQSDHRY